MSDLISRQSALDAIEPIIYDILQDKNDSYKAMCIPEKLRNLPSAESTGAMDEAIQQYIKDGWMQDIRPKGECNWCANLEDRHLRIEYYWIDDDGNTASFTGKDTHVIATGIARFCPCCGRPLTDMRGDSE